MTHVLNARERKALDRLTEDHSVFLIKGQLTGIGATTLASLVDLGLAETGPSKRFYGETGWRITPDGWRCMYGETIAEILAKPDGVKSFPFVAWIWPPDPNGARRRV